MYHREHTDGLHRLSQSHIVGETSSEIVVIEIFYPFYALFLIGAQLGVEVFGLELLLFQSVESLIHLAMMLASLAFEWGVDKFLNLRQVEE